MTGWPGPPPLAGGLVGAGSIGFGVEVPVPTWMNTVPVSLLPSRSTTVYSMESLPCQSFRGVYFTVPSLEKVTAPPAALLADTSVTLRPPSLPTSLSSRYLVLNQCDWFTPVL